MNEIMTVFLLLSIPGLPLLLAFPVVRSYLPWPCYISLLPAIIVIFVPIDFSIKIPWLLFSTGLAIDEVSRLLLAMSVLLWATSAHFLQRSGKHSSADRIGSYFMLTLAANLGAILATDLLSFFTFSTLMAYGFYALLVSEQKKGEGEEEQRRRSARIYLSFMILADLLLFEALIIAAATTDNLAYEAVQHAMTQSSSTNLYISMVILGFIAKAGIWPLHFWLPLVFRSCRAEVTMLLGGVPIAIGLLGSVRWLPLGEITFSEMGILVQILGIAAMLYAIIAGLIRAQLQRLAIDILIMSTGLFITALGVGLTYPAAWQQYGNLSYFFIVSLGIGFTMLVMATRWLQSKYASYKTPLQRPDFLSQYLKQHRPLVSRHVIKQKAVKAMSYLHTDTGYPWYSASWKKILENGEHLLLRWDISITLFLLLAVMIVFIEIVC